MKIQKAFISLAFIAILLGGASTLPGQDSSGEDGKGEIKPLSGGEMKSSTQPESKSGTSGSNGKNEKTKADPKGKAVVKTGEKEPGKADTLNKAPDGADVNENISSSILYLQEGDYRYGRIPGIELKIRAGKVSGGADEKVREDAEKIPEKIDLQDLKEKDGRKKDRSDLAAKAGLVFLILLIFVLYRLRSSRSGGRTLKRYPK